MNITIAICTWNRCDLLERSLEGLCTLAIPEGLAWEVFVVDNNSTDGTQAVIERFRERLPLRSCVELQQGLSHARNRAMAESSGDLLVWTDDDVEVEPDWIAEYWAASKRWPEAGFFSGHVDPWFETPPAPELAEAFDFLQHGYCFRDFGSTEKRLEPHAPVVGANLMMRRQAVGETRFDPELGLRGGQEIRGEESVFLDCLEAKGYYGVWVPSARLKHFIPNERVTLDYVKRFCRGNGRTYVRKGLLADGARVAGIPRWLLRRYLERFLWRYLGAPFRATSEQYRLCDELWRLEGTIAECWDRRNRS